MDLGELEGDTYRDFLVNTGGSFPDNTATNFYNDIVRVANGHCDITGPAYGARHRL